MELHILTCKRDFDELLVAVKSFYHWNKIDWKLIIHSDGSLTNNHYSIIKDHVEDIRIVELEEANEITLKGLENYPNCYNFRKNYMQTHLKVVFLKIFDPLMFCNEDYYMMLDSDVFTFERCDRILNFVEKKIPFYHGGGWGYLKYPVSLEALNEIGLKPVGNLNSGIIGLSKKMFNLDICEKYFDLLNKNPGKIDNNFDTYTGEEEPLFSCLMGESNESKVLWVDNPPNWVDEYIKPLQDEKLYKINSDPFDCVMCHYAGNTKRSKYYKTAITYAKQRMMLSS